MPNKARQKVRLDRLVRCPQCHRNVRPWLMKIIPAYTTARPPIPERNVVKCSAKGCGDVFYITAETISNAD